MTNYEYGSMQFLDTLMSGWLLFYQNRSKIYIDLLSKLAGNASYFIILIQLFNKSSNDEFSIKNSMY